MGLSLDRKDGDWIRRSFLVRKSDLEPNDYANRVFTTASLKYTDTTPGGSHCINPPPQFTRHADIRVKGVFSSGSAGLGRYYSEAIEDNSQVIHMRFGVEQYNSITQFFTGFYNSQAGQLARTGRASDAFYYMGKAAGYVVQLASWKLLAVHFLGRLVTFLSTKPTSKFYYLKPAMPLYLNAAQTMLNHLAVNRGIVPRKLTNPDAIKMTDGYVFDQEGIDTLHSKMPNIFNKNGTIDLYAIMNRAKRLERKRMVRLGEIMDAAGDLGITDLRSKIREIYTAPLTDDRPGTMGGYLERWLSTDQSKPKSGDNESSNTTETLDSNKSNWDKFSEFLNAELDDGAAFVSFRVNATGPIQNSFSNNAGPSELQEKINGISSQARSANFSFANGNLLGGAAGKILGSAITAVKNFTTGVLDSVELTGLATLAGAAFVDIPDTWKSSMAGLPTMSYTIDLVSPYGNPISQMLNLDLPLVLLLAGALPKSTGRQSYTGPFLVELYDQGRCQTRLGMIDSLSITRGTGNIGFSQDGKALGIQVSFTVKDMSSIMHMPIVENFSLMDVAAQAVGSLAGNAGREIAVGLTGGAFDDDTVYSDYLAVLAGMSLPDQIYSFRKLKLNLTKKMVNYDSFMSVSHMASFMGDTFPMKIVSAFYRGTDKQ